jgi:hypothetical protein
LEKYIKSEKYEPFAIPRSDWGVGTSITFKKGKEEIIALNENCLKLDGDTTNSFMANQSYSINSSNNLELSLAKLFDSKVNIQSAFSNGKVKKIIITVKDVQETIIPIITIKQKISEFSQTNNEACMDAILGKKNVVITRTLSIGSLSYKFMDVDNKEIIIDAGLLKTIKLSDSLQRQYEGSMELSIDKRAFLGYRVTQFKGKPGMTDTSITDKLLDPAAVKNLKNLSR